MSLAGFVRGDLQATTQLTAELTACTLPARELLARQREGIQSLEAERTALSHYLEDVRHVVDDASAQPHALERRQRALEERATLLAELDREEQRCVALRAELGILAREA